MQEKFPVNTDRGSTGFNDESIESADKARCLDRVHGCLLGGAIGDALGYPVEFMSEDKIFTTYGPDGVREFDLDEGVARISDDTQMTLFTANGLLNALWRAANREGSADYVSSVYQAYLDWLKTQLKLELDHSETWLFNQPELYAHRAPGHTCI